MVAGTSNNNNFESQMDPVTVAFERVNEQIERQANQKLAKTLALREQERRVEEDNQFTVQENLERAANVEKVSRWVSDEKSRRELLGVPTHEKYFERVPIVANDAARKVLKRIVLRDEEEERSSRIMDDAKTEFISNLQREFNRQRVNRRVEKERVRRITQDRKTDLLNDIERRRIRKEVVDAQEEERRRLEIANEGIFSLPEAELKAAVNESVISAYNQRATLRAENVARLEKLLQTIFQDCATEASRVANQKKADKSADTERQDRIWRDEYTKVASLSAAGGRHRELLSAIQATKQDLTDHEDETLKARNSCAQLAEILCDISRRGNQKQADQQMDEEKEYRVLMTKKNQALGELERVVSWRHTKALLDDRIAEIAHNRLQQAVLSELDSRSKSKTISMLIEENREEWCKMVNEKETKALPTEVLESLERRGNQRLAVEEMDEEKRRRITNEMFGQVLEDLERTVAWRNTLELLEDEVARVQHCRHLATTLRELENNSRAKEIEALVEMRRQELLAEPSSPSVDAEVLVAIERRGNQRRALKEMDQEKERRVVEGKSRVVHDEIIRAVNIKTVSKEVANEQASRITKMKASRVFEELGQKRRRNEVAAAVELERAERMAAMKEQMTLLRTNNLFQALLDQLQYDSRKKDVFEQCDLEKMERINHDRFDWVLEDLLRQLNRMEAAALADTERDRRVALQHKADAFEEMDRRVTLREVDNAMDNEQQDRISRAADDLKVRSSMSVLFDIFEGVERLHNKKVALTEMECERQRRILVQSFGTVMEQLERTISIRNVDRDMDTERATRVAVNKFAEVIVELERHHNQTRADEEADLEQKERVESRETLLGESTHDLSDCHRQLLSKASWKMTNDLVEEERQFYAIIDKARLVHEELVRKANTKYVVELVEIEQARLIHVDRLHAALGELAALFREKERSALLEEERTRRIADAATRAMRFASMARLFLSDISTNRANSDDLGFMVVDPSDEWAKVSPR